MFERINKFIGEIRDEFYERSKDVADTKKQEQIFAEVLSASNYFAFCAEPGLQFSVHKKSYMSGAGWFFESRKTEWEVNLAIITTEKSFSIGVITFKNFDAAPCVTFSNKAIQEMVENKKSFSDVRNSLEISNKRAYEIIDELLNKRTLVSSMLLKEPPVDKLLADILDNPTSQSVSSFNVDQLKGGKDFLIQSLYLLGLIIGLAIVIPLAIGVSHFHPVGLDELERFAEAFKILFPRVFGLLIGAVAIFFSLPLLSYEVFKPRTGAAKQIEELLESTKEVIENPHALNMFRALNNDSDPTKNSDAVSYQSVFSENKNKYQWEKGEKDLLNGNVFEV